MSLNRGPESMSCEGWDSRARVMAWKSQPGANSTIQVGFLAGLFVSGQEPLHQCHS